MFEQSVLPKPASRRPQAFAAVTLLEISMVAGTAAVSLFRIPAITPPKLPVIVHYFHAVPLVEPPLQATTAARPSITAPRRFYAPALIPHQIAKVDDLISPGSAVPEAPSAFAASGSSIPGALDLKGQLPPTPPPPAKASTEPIEHPLHVSSGVQASKLIRKVMPVYPRIAIRTRQSGAVRLMATIGIDGRVKAVKVLGGPAFLSAAAIEAVKQWVYQPTLLNGRPVEVIAEIEVNFTFSG